MELTNGEFARHLLVAADMLDCADNSGNKIVPGIVRSMRKASGIITAYEETMGRLGLTPDDLPHAAELLKAEKEGRCVMLPCRVGDTVYTIFADYLACEECAHGKEPRFKKEMRCKFLELPECHNVPRRIKEHVVCGFEVGLSGRQQPTVSDPGQWGCEGLETFSGTDGKWYLTRTEAEAALEKENRPN